MHKKTIWILDDDPSICEALKIVFEDVGCQVRVFDNGQDLIKRLKSEKPNIVVMDILLTNESGFDISKKIREQNDAKQLPLILMSANKTEEEQIKDSGAQAFIRKPFDIYELVDLVDKFCK